MPNQTTLCPQCFKGTVDTTKLKKLANCTHCNLQFYVVSFSRVVNPYSKGIKPKKIKESSNGFLGTGIQYREVTLPGRVIRKKKKVKRKRRK